VTDKYNNEVTQLARPLPVEYLLVDLPAAFPVDAAFTFYADVNVRPFVVAHRDDIGEIQVCIFNMICLTIYRLLLLIYCHGMWVMHDKSHAHMCIFTKRYCIKMTSLW